MLSHCSISVPVNTFSTVSEKSSIFDSVSSVEKAFTISFVSMVVENSSVSSFDVIKACSASFSSTCIDVSFSVSVPFSSKQLSISSKDLETGCMVLVSPLIDSIFSLIFEPSMFSSVSSDSPAPKDTSMFMFTPNVTLLFTETSFTVSGPSCI